jgi:HEAT repeats
MIRAYYNAKSDDPEVKRFVDRLFETSSDPNIRAAVIRAKADFRPKMKPDDLETLRTVAVSDKDFEVRLAALAGLGGVDTYRIHKTMAARVTTAR